MFLYLILIILAIYILPPLIRGILTINRFRRSTRQAYEAMYGNRNRRPQERKAGWSGKPSDKKKKIGKDVGEYISFEEITVTETESTVSDNAGNTFTEVEQQITDVEWEDVK